MNTSNLSSGQAVGSFDEQNNTNISEQIKAAKNEYNNFVNSALNNCITDDKSLSDFINTMSAFPKLSIRNCLAIFAQNPTAKELMSTELIKRASGRIISGEKGISLLVPNIVGEGKESKTYYNIKKFFDISQVSLPKTTLETNNREAVTTLSADCLNITNAIKGVSNARMMYTSKDSHNSYYDFKTKISYINSNQLLGEMTYDMLKNLVAEKSYFGTIKNPLREQYVDLTTAIVAGHFNIASPQLSTDIFKECTSDDALNILNTVKEQAKYLINNIECELHPQLLYKNYDISYSKLEAARDANDNPLYNKEQLHQFKLAIDKRFNPSELSVLCSSQYSSETISQGIRAISDNIPLPLVNSLLRNYNSQQISALRLIYQSHPSNKRMTMLLNPALTGLQLYGLNKILTNDQNCIIDDVTFTRLCSGYYDNHQLETIAIILGEKQLTAEQLKKIINTRLDSPTMIAIKEAYISGVEQSEVDQIISSATAHDNSAEIRQLLNEVMNKHNVDKNICALDDFSLESLIASAEYEATRHNNNIPISSAEMNKINSINNKNT